MRFKDRPYLVELYVDAPKLDGFDAMKCVQVGWSEMLIQLVFERAGWSGRICGYVLPTYQLRDRFVRRRVEPLVGRDEETNVEAYRRLVPGDDHGSLRHKRFGKGALLFLGSNAINDFIEFSADVLVVDEYDRCNQANLSFARDRLRASVNPQMFRVSNPTIPGRGISALYDASDGRKWHHRCSRCGERQPIDWFINIVERDSDGRWVLRDRKRKSSGVVRPVCRKCLKPWNRSAEGCSWVPERPSVSRRGYHVCRMDVLSEDLRGLYTEWLEAQGNIDKMTAFYAGVLGLPYSPSGGSVTAEMLSNAACSAPMNHAGFSASADPSSRVVICGADIGGLINVDICEVRFDENTQKSRRIGIWTGEVISFEELYDILVRFKVNVAVIDSRPETRKAQELRDKARMSGVCEVWLCEFHKTERIGAQDFGMSLDWSRFVVKVDRTQLLDATLADLRLDPPLRTWPEDIWEIRHWRSQMEAPKRVRKPNGEGYIWDSSRAADHFRFSDAYSRVALALLSMQGSYYAE